MSVAASLPGPESQALAARNTLNQIAQASFRRFPDRVALTDLSSPSSESLTYQDLADRTFLIASALDYLGVRRGDAVAVLGGEGLSWITLYLAALHLGAIMVPLARDLPADTLRQILDETSAVVAVAEDPSTLDHLVQSLGHPSHPKYLLLVEGHAKGDVLDWTVLQEMGRQHPISDTVYRRMWSSISPSERALLLYNRDVRGDLRGVELTHRNIISTVESLQDLFTWTESDVCLCALPPRTPFGLAAGLFTPLSAGANLVLTRPGEGMAETCISIRPTVFMGETCLLSRLHYELEFEGRQTDEHPPRISEWAVQIGRKAARAEMRGLRPDPTTTLRRAIADRLVLRERRGRLGGRMRYAFSVGTGLPDATLEFFHAVGIPLLEIYGREETAGFMVSHRPGAIVPGTTGLSAPGCEVMIAPDGEILCRGRQVSPGYWNRPGASRQAFGSQGWFRTGDLGHLDSTGAVVLTGRKTNLIHLDGRAVNPLPIENKLRESPYIQDAALLPCGKYGVVALIVPQFSHVREMVNAPDDTAFWFNHPEVCSLIQSEVDRLIGEEYGDILKRIQVLAEEFRTSEEIIGEPDRAALAHRYPQTDF